MNLDRWITCRLAAPLARCRQGGAKRRIPILMYHSVMPEAQEGGLPYFWLNTTPAVFDSHLRQLREYGYRVVNLSALPRSGADAGEKLAVITFDDGFQSVHQHAFDILQRHGCTATVFLPTDYIAEPRRSFSGKACLTWNEVRELCRHGFEMGSHTVSHPLLDRLPRGRVESEVRNSKAIVEDVIGAAVTSFSYPFGFPSEDGEFIGFMRELLHSAGYRFGVTTMVGTVSEKDDPLVLKRVPMSSRDEGAFFRLKLEGCYDWVHVPQQLFKALKRWKRRAAA